MSDLNSTHPNQTYLSPSDSDRGNEPDFDTMTPAQFEQYLPELFAAGGPHVSADPRLQSFLVRNPDCAALVHDLEAIAQAAKDIFAVEPSDSVWSKIQEGIGELTASPHPLPEAE